MRRLNGGGEREKGVGAVETGCMLMPESERACEGTRERFSSSIHPLHTERHAGFFSPDAVMRQVSRHYCNPSHLTSLDAFLATPDNSV